MRCVWRHCASHNRCCIHDICCALCAAAQRTGKLWYFCIRHVWTGEMKLNPDVLKEMGVDAPLGSPKADVSKTWMDFDASLPAMPRMPEKKVVLTLRPYTANTKYNWDPVYQKKITVNKNTWRGNPFYELIRLKIYTDWVLESNKERRWQEKECCLTFWS